MNNFMCNSYIMNDKKKLIVILLGKKELFYDICYYLKIDKNH